MFDARRGYFRYDIALYLEEGGFSYWDSGSYQDWPITHWQTIDAPKVPDMECPF